MSIDQALRKAQALARDGEIAEAEAIYREILGRFPANKRAQQGLASLSAPQGGKPPQQEIEALVALYREGRMADALERALALQSGYSSEVLSNITGALCAALGRPDEAAAHYRRAIELAPDYFEAHNNLGNVLRLMRQLDDALASFDRAIRLKADFAEAHMNRGIVLYDMKRLDEALASYARAIQLNPQRAEAHNNRGNTLLDLKRLDEALASFDRAITLAPGHAAAHLNRGNVLKVQKRFDEALASYDRAIVLSPGLPEAHNNRGTVLKALKRLDEALASYRQALTLKPDYALAKSEVLNLQAHMCLWGSEPALDAQDIASGAVSPFYMLRLEDDPAVQLDCARAWTRTKYGQGQAGLSGRSSRGGKIRLGYFSADFHNHATMYLIARLFELHDKGQFEVHAFSYGPDQQDEMRARLTAAVDGFHDCRAIGDAETAALARKLGIDIAIDLKGHTEDTRSGIFAFRAAPLQLSYLGYPGTMGADFIDHIVADAVTVPEGQELFYSENVIRLPGCYQGNDDRRTISDRRFSRAELGLPERGFVFCCFNNNYKIGTAEFDIWMRLLGEVDGSVLWLLEDNRWAADNLRKEAQARGVDPARLVFAGRMPLAEHLARHRCADLFLDTFNYNAHTTASDALWTGLPLVTRPGRSFAARVAGSLLHATGLDDLVTDTAAAYEALALGLARDPARLDAVRAKLAANRSNAALFDSARFTRDLESAYLALLAR